MPKTSSRIKRAILLPCANADQLFEWIKRYLELTIPRQAVCPAHDAPFEYIRRAYFEPAVDQIVWAPRGGGKTRLAAVLTLLDLLHKPACSIAILGGSLLQSQRIWEHLLPDIKSLAWKQVLNPNGCGTRLSLRNGSSAIVLTQSQRSVRGLRVQKLRCDEVELFRPEIWQAAQLVTKSRGNLRAGYVRGRIEAISTLHN